MHGESLTGRFNSATISCQVLSMLGSCDFAVAVTRAICSAGIISAIVGERGSHDRDRSVSRRCVATPNSFPPLSYPTPASSDSPIMAVKILHTADNHIGLSFRHYPDAVRDRLIGERFAALQRIVEIANQGSAHFITVAGDLFVRVTVGAADIKGTVDILKGFEGEGVLVLAGNHDYCEGPDSKLWKTFRKAAEGSNVMALTEPRAHDFNADEVPVRFYACPCPSKHGAEPGTGWVAEEAKPADMLHLGLAHGNVEGLGLDADNRYFNMTEADLRASALHSWLLGHIHVPAPEIGITGRPLYFMPGIHTPDSVKSTRAGQAWWIEFDAQGDCRFEPVVTSEIRFVRIAATLEHTSDIEALARRCSGLDASATLLDLQLSGRLKSDELQQLNDMVSELRDRFLHIALEHDIAEVLEPAAIASRFPAGTLPGDLLTALVADEEHPGDAHLALEIIESLS